MRALRVVAIAFALLAMAWPSSPPKALAGLAGSEWRIVEIAGAKVNGVATMRFTQTSIRGKAPCNVFFGAFRERQGSVEIGGLNETRMHCAGSMEIEKALLDGLARVRAYKIDGATLALMDGDGNVLVRLAGGAL